MNLNRRVFVMEMSDVVNFLVNVGPKSMLSIASYEKSRLIKGETTVIEFSNLRV